MFQGTNQEIANDTQCSLFGCYQFTSITRPAPSSHNLADVGTAQNKFKHRKIVTNLTRPYSNNSNHESSHDRGKINLSKLALKNSSDSNPVYQNKRASNIVESKLSKPLSHRSQNNAYNNASFTFNEINYRKNGQSSISFNNTSHFFAGEQHNKDLNYQHKKSLKQSPQIYEMPLVGANMQTLTTHLKPQTPYKKNIIFQYSNQDPLPLPSTTFIRNTPAASTREQKILDELNQPQVKMVSSHHHRLSQMNNSYAQNPSQLNLKGVHTVTPTQQTDRILAASLATSNKVVRQRFSIQNSSHLNLKESQYDQRLAQTLGPGFSNQRLNTVQSFTGSDAGLSKRDIHESVIIIDFFNPDQKLRQQIEEKIRNQKHESLP